MGVALLILVLAVMNGFDREMRVRILAMVPHATIFGAGAMQEWPEVVAIAERTPGVTGAAPFVQMQAMLMAGDQARAVLLQAVLPERKALSVVRDFMVEGEFTDLLRNEHGVVVSRVLADKLGAQVGRNVAVVVPADGKQGATRLMPRIYQARIVGIYASNTEIDNFLAYIPLGFGQRIAHLGSGVHGVQLKVEDLMTAGHTAGRVLQQLQGAYYARDWTRTHGNLFEAIQLSRKLVSFLVFIIIAVAAFNVVTAMIMVVRDKQGDVAILQTMGMEQGDIVKLFVFHGLVIGLIGTGIGAAAGLLLAANITGLVQWLEQLLDYQFLKSDVYPVTYLPADIRAEDVGLVCATALALTLVATLYPAWRAARLLPADVLRYDK